MKQHVTTQINNIPKPYKQSPGMKPPARAEHILKKPGGAGGRAPAIPSKQLSIFIEETNSLEQAEKLFNEQNKTSTSTRF